MDYDSGVLRFLLDIAHERHSNGLTTSYGTYCESSNSLVLFHKGLPTFNYFTLDNGDVFRISTLEKPIIFLCSLLQKKHFSIRLLKETKKHLEVRITYIEESLYFWIDKDGYIKYVIYRQTGADIKDRALNAIMSDYYCARMLIDVHVTRHFSVKTRLKKLNRVAELCSEETVMLYAALVRDICSAKV